VSNFLNEIKINDKVVLCKELKVKHYKIILKCLLGNDVILCLNNINSILLDITNLTNIEINKLNFIDYFLLLLEIRRNNISNTILAETIDDKSTKITINISKIINIIQNIKYQHLLVPDNVDSFYIYYKLPTIREISYIETDSLETVYGLFLKEIITNNIKIPFSNLKKNTLNELFVYFPAKLTTHLVKRAENIISIFNDINLLSYIPGLKDKHLMFNFNINNLYLLIKLLFGDQLLSLYSNIFELSKQINMSPEYIENCTPGEYGIFVKKLEALNNDNNTQPSIDIQPNVNTKSTNSLNPYTNNEVPPINSTPFM